MISSSLFFSGFGYLFYFLTFLVFVCVVSDKKGLEKSSNKLQFANPQDMELQRKAVSPASNDLTFNCRAIGTEPIRYTWYKNNIIFHARRVDSTLQTDKPELKLKDLVPSDSATYTCEARNNFGFIRYNFSLAVQGMLWFSFFLFLYSYAIFIFFFCVCLGN